MNKKMKSILLQLSNGTQDFKCEHKGVENKCKILEINLVMSSARVRYHKPVKIMRTIWEEHPWTGDPISKQIEVEEKEGWINI